MVRYIETILVPGSVDEGPGGGFIGIGLSLESLMNEPGSWVYVGKSGSWVYVGKPGSWIHRGQPDTEDPGAGQEYWSLRVSLLLKSSQSLVSQ